MHSSARCAQLLAMFYTKHVVFWPVFSLMHRMHTCLQDNPKSSQQRQRYETARQQAEQQRVAVQKQAWLKQSLARRRVEASRQQQQLLLHSRAQAFHAKVDAIRSALLAYSPFNLERHVHGATKCVSAYMATATVVCQNSIKCISSCFHTQLIGLVTPWRLA